MALGEGRPLYDGIRALYHHTRFYGDNVIWPFSRRSADHMESREIAAQVTFFSLHELKEVTLAAAV